MKNKLQFSKVCNILYILKISITYLEDWIMYGMGLLQAKHVLNGYKVETLKHKSYLCNRCFQLKYIEKFEDAYQSLTNWSKIAATERQYNRSA